VKKRREAGPGNHCGVGKGRGTQKDTGQQHPHVDVATAGDEPKAQQERAGFVQISAPAASEEHISEIVRKVESNDGQRRVPSPGGAACRESVPDGEVPGILVKEIEDVLQLSDPRGHQLDAGELAVHAVENLDDEGEENRRGEQTAPKQPRAEERKDGGDRRHLIRRDRSRCQEPHQEVFERRVEQQGGKILGTLVDMVEQHRLRVRGVFGTRNADEMNRYIAALPRPIGWKGRRGNTGKVASLSVRQGADARSVERAQQLRWCIGCGSDQHVGFPCQEPLEQALVDDQVGSHEQKTIRQLVRGSGEQRPDVVTSAGREDTHPCRHPLRGSRGAPPAAGCDDALLHPERRELTQ